MACRSVRPASSAGRRQVRLTTALAEYTAVRATPAYKAAFAHLSEQAALCFEVCRLPRLPTLPAPTASLSAASRHAPLLNKIPIDAIHTLATVELCMAVPAEGPERDPQSWPVTEAGWLRARCGARLTQRRAAARAPAWTRWSPSLRARGWAPTAFACCPLQAVCWTSCYDTSSLVTHCHDRPASSPIVETACWTAFPQCVRAVCQLLL